MENVPRDVTTREACREGGWEYFWGSVCRRGHDGKRYVDGHCVECSVARATSPDAVAKKNARRRADKTVATAYNEKYYRENREREIERVRVYQEENAEMVRAKAKIWRDGRRKERAEVCRKWRQENPDMRRANEHKRRALKEAGEGFTGKDVKDLYKKQGGKCGNCLVSIKGGYHIDHVVPLSRGGMNDKSNLELLCPKCNQSKYNKLPHEWARLNGRLI